jgi:hypothetical protein
VKRKGSAPAHLDEVGQRYEARIWRSDSRRSCNGTPTRAPCWEDSGTSPCATWTPAAPRLVVAEAIEAALGCS